jgi:hypothetical protein
MVAAQATTIVPPEFDALANDSDYIVHAVTKAVSAEKETTSRGHRIVTHVELKVIEVVAGRPPKTITLQMLGGRVGDERMIVEGMPEFRAGDEDVLFVRGNGRSFCPLYGMSHGRFRVQTDAATGRKHVERFEPAAMRGGQPQTPGSSARARQNALGGTAVDLPDFIRQIRAAIRPDARLLRAK